MRGRGGATPGHGGRQWQAPRSVRRGPRFGASVTDQEQAVLLPLRFGANRDCGLLPGGSSCRAWLPAARIQEAWLLASSPGDGTDSSSLSSKSARCSSPSVRWFLPPRRHSHLQEQQEVKKNRVLLMSSNFFGSIQSIAWCWEAGVATRNRVKSWGATPPRRVDTTSLF